MRYVFNVCEACDVHVSAAITNPEGSHAILHTRDVRMLPSLHVIGLISSQPIAQEFERIMNAGYQAHVQQAATYHNVSAVCSPLGLLLL